VVRSPDKRSVTGLGALLQGAGFSRAQDDGYAVRDYILSRDALQKLESKYSISKSYSSKNIDLFNRFGGFDHDYSFEALLRYYLKHVTVESDSLSSISTLTVRAYTNDEAFRINENLLEASEALVNQLNERGRQDMIRFATHEVVSTKEHALAAALAVSNYRNQNHLFDPAKQTTLQLQMISKLQDQLITAKSQLKQIQALTPNNPQIAALQGVTISLQASIDSETAKVAGSGSSLSHKSVEYERLNLESIFADKQLAIAFTSLEQARNEAQRKQFYLERIVQPNKPDVAMEPWRIRNIFATFMLGLILWGVLSMLLAGVREHQDHK
jgi:capsular polysaccharide transport system permease protein